MKKTNRTEWEIRCAFNAFCKSVLKNKSIDIHRKRENHFAKESVFSHLTPNELSQLYSIDEYSNEFQSVQVADKTITMALLIDALNILSDEKRDLILMYYFSELSDQEISNRLNIPRSTIQYRRKIALNRLKRYLEVHLNE